MILWRSAVECLKRSAAGQTDSGSHEHKLPLHM